MTRLIIIFIAVITAWQGCDGLSVNKDLVEYTIDQIESRGIGDDRYIQISGGYTTGDFVYEHFGNSSQATKVIFPLVDEKKFNSSQQDNKNIGYIKVLVERDAKKYNENCPNDLTCLNHIFESQSNGNYVVKGVTMVGFDDVDDETKKLLSGSDFKISPNVVYLKENSEPKSNTTSILMLIGGILGVIITIGSYFIGD